MSSPSISEICQFIKDDLDAVEKKLREKTASHYDFVDLAVQHVIEGGGKRLRPVLLVLSAKACGYDGEDAHTLAVVVELIHVASLVHDDVLDEAPIRRKRETLHSKWGNKVAVLVGDYLHARVLSMLVARHADDPAMSILSDATQAMCEGEVIHAYKNGDFNISQDDYLKIVGLKTGRLITASCMIGAILGTKDEKIIQALREYGEAVGAAFQIIDDLLDFVADQEKFGKQSFSDLREGKLTFPMIYTREVCTAEERTTLEQVFNADTEPDSAIEWIEALLRRYRTQAHCLGAAQVYADRAKSALAALPDTPAGRALQQLADYVVSRDW
ncbi:MAG: polyprenyl synthetase family protein [Candidatus Poribacteria bacterium]|nr:polyprenyl synthetase family protein [Candidatus Poribacteria bacterium]